MKTFNDTAGRTWSVALNLGTALAVKDALGVDLLQPEQGDPPLLTRLGTDEMLLGEVLCCMLAGQFEANHVTDDELRRSFDGATLLAAQNAFYQELADFFRSRGRTDRARMIERQKAMIDAGIRAIETRVEAIDVHQTIEQRMKQVDAMLAETAGGMSGESPAASTSIPAR